MENNKQPTINAEEMEAAQNFEMFYVPSKIPNKKQKRLIIYTSPEKTNFFEFYHNPDDDTFYCKDCINVRPCVAVRLVEDPENPRKKKIKFVSKQEEQKEETVEEGTRRSTRKRVRNPVVADDDDSAENAPIQKKKRDSIEVVDAENYEEVQIVRRNGHVIHRLLIYTSPERTARYEFNYNRFAESYHCRICLSMNSVVSVKLFKDGADEKMKFRLGINDHICEPFQAEDFNDEGMVSGSLLEVKAEPNESSEGVAVAEEEQEQFLEEAKRLVKEQAFYMRQSIENAKLRDVLKHASNLLNELKAEKLSPKNYYILFMQVFDELRVLEAGIKEEYKRGRRMSDLYENVQHAGGLIPRLYLLITVGSIYISTHEISAKDILSDLMEMMKGVQHPIKGLFLRYYFLKLCKDRLPDKGSEYEGEGGDYNDAINTILSNLSEMNKLWIKVQTTPGKEKAKREKDRNDLKVTIGENLVRLSQLEGCTLEVYKEFVLDKLIEIITSKDDKMSQQYLMDCIIQAFPDEYHINTLEKLLQTCALIMQNNVDIKTIFIRLMDRLADFAANSEGEVNNFSTELDLFAMFKKNIDNIIEDQGATVELKKFLELQVAFLKFSIQCYPTNIEYVNDILKSCCTLCQKQSTVDFDEDSLKSIVKLLTLPLDSLSIAVLQMDEFPKLMKYLPLNKRRIVALKICQAVTVSAIPLSNLQIIGQIVDFIDPLLKESSELADIDPTEFEQEQHLVARLAHLVHHENPDSQFQMLEGLKEQFFKGGVKRQFHTLPALVFAYFKLGRYITECIKRRGYPEETPATTEGEEEQAPKIYNLKTRYFKGGFEVTFRRVYEVVHEIIGKLTGDYPDLCMKLYLEFAQIISECDQAKELDEETYDLFTQILEIYQNDIAGAEEKISAIAVITSTLHQISNLSPDNFDGLATNTASYSSMLLRRYDQCLAVLDSTHLFYCQAQRKEDKIMEGFRKALKSTDAIFNTHPNEKNFTLYIAILNKFLYYFAQHNFQGITTEDVQRCMDVVKGKLEKLKEKEDPYLVGTLNFIELKKKEDTKFQGLSW